MLSLTIVSERAICSVGVGGVSRTSLEAESANRWALPLDMLLLLLLSMAHLWFNPVSNAFVVTLLAFYVLLGLIFPKMTDELESPHPYHRGLFTVRLTIVLFVVCVAAILPTGLNILQRHAQGPATNANDGLIQVEESIKFLLNGRNPYTENYLNTPMADWKGGEPPWDPVPGTLYHNAYLPFLFFFSMPFYCLIHGWLGWYDQRILYLLAYFGLLFIFPLLVQRQRDKLSLLSALGLNSLFTFFLADGRNDILILFGLVLATVLLAKRHATVSALVLGLTLAMKHTAWFFLPFFFVYFLPRRPTLASVRTALWRIMPFAIVVAVCILPFVIWDAPSFFDDTILYLIGVSPDAYPIRGWGLSMLLYGAGIIPTAYSQFPFGLLEILLGLPTLLFLLYRQLCDNTLQRLWFSFAIFSFVIQYLSRFFNDNYVVFVLQSFIIASFIVPLRWNLLEDKQDGSRT